MAKQPQIQVRPIDKERSELPTLLKKDNLVGIELGVASGDFSARLWNSGSFKELWGVDAYGDHHDTAEYIDAIKLVGLQANYRLVRMFFDDALSLFPDEYFDFVYIDGYAHTGENSGRTLYQWLPKVKVGGMIAGHDYHPDWPLVMEATNQFASDAKLELMVTKLTEVRGPQDDFPSWAAIRSAESTTPEPPATLQWIDTAAKAKVRGGKAHKLKPKPPSAGISASRNPLNFLRMMKAKIKTEPAGAQSPLLSELAGQGKGRDLLILGSAPSLNDLDLGAVDGCDVLFLNKAAALAGTLNADRKMVMISDPLAMAEYGSDLDLENFDYRLFASAVTPPEGLKVHWFGFYDRPNLFHGLAQKDLTKPLFHCHTVAGFALQAAVGLGYERVFLAGVDLNFNEGQTHYYAGSAREEKWRKDVSAPKSERMQAGLAYLAHWAKKNGVEVANLSPVEGLPLVPRRPFQEVFPS